MQKGTLPPTQILQMEYKGLILTVLDDDYYHFSFLRPFTTSTSRHYISLMCFGGNRKDKKTKVLTVAAFWASSWARGHQPTPVKPRACL